MPTLPPIAVVPMFVRCRWCQGVFRADTTWPTDERTAYRRCRWCDRLTKIPVTPTDERPTGPAGSGGELIDTRRVSATAPR